MTSCEMRVCEDPWGREHDLSAGTEAWSFTQDHIIPLSEGGLNVAANRRPAHRLCNRIDSVRRRGFTPKRDLATIALWTRIAAAEAEPPRANL